MPYRRIGKCVYKKTGTKWIKRGCSPTIERAKAYLRALYWAEGETEGKRRKRK